MNENIPCRSAKSRRASFGRHLCVSVCVCASVQHYMCKQCKEKELMSCVCFSPYRNLRCVSSVSSWYSRWLPPPKRPPVNVCVSVCVVSVVSNSNMELYGSLSPCLSMNTVSQWQWQTFYIFVCEPSVFCSETLTCWAFCASVFKLLLLLKLHIQISSWEINEEQEREFTRVNCT